MAIVKDEPLDLSKKEVNDSSILPYKKQLAGSTHVDISTNFLTFKTLEWFADNFLFCKLSLSNSHFQYAGAIAISNMPSLRVLEVNNCGLTDDSFRELVRMPSLHVLHCDKNQVTSKGLHDLKYNNSLRELSLKQNHLTSACIPFFKSHCTASVKLSGLGFRADPTVEMEEAMTENRRRCQLFVSTVEGFLKTRSQVNLLTQVPNEIIQIILFHSANGLPKHAIHIANMIILLTQNFLDKNKVSQVTAAQKKAAVSLLTRYKLCDQSELDDLPEQYTDDAELKLFC